MISRLAQRRARTYTKGDQHILQVRLFGADSLLVGQICRFDIPMNNGQ